MTYGLATPPGWIPSVRCVIVDEFALQIGVPEILGSLIRTKLYFELGTE